MARKVKIMSKIYIKLASDECYETLKVNINVYAKQFHDNPSDNSWIYETLPEKPFIEKKLMVDDFELVVPNSIEDDISNHIKLYEALNHLPKYILADKRFWLWLMLEKHYTVSLAMMEKMDATAFRHQWLFVDGDRRGLFFNVLSRCYYRVALTVDDTLEDIYELSKFAIENPLRFREYSWRSISNHDFVIKGALRAEKSIVEKYGEKVEKGTYYAELAKELSKLGSVKLVDAMSKDDVFEYVYSKYEGIILKDMQNNYERARELGVSSSAKDIIKAIELLNEIKPYKDSSELIEKYRQKISTLSKSKTSKKKSLFKLFGN